MNKQVCEYKVVNAALFADSETLEKEVNELIQDGWQPLGNAIPVLSGACFVVQTMVKYSEAAE